MAKAEDYEIRSWFTAIGCIMEDASLIALVWSAEDELDAKSRSRRLSDAHIKIGELLAQIDIIV